MEDPIRSRTVWNEFHAPLSPRRCSRHIRIVESAPQVETFCTIPTFHSNCRNMLSVGLNKLRKHRSEFGELFEKDKGQEDV